MSRQRPGSVQAACRQRAGSVQARAGTCIFRAGPPNALFFDVEITVRGRAGFPPNWPIYNIKSGHARKRAEAGPCSEGPWSKVVIIEFY